MNAQDLFNILPKNFFSILSSHNQMMYIDCLFLMYSYFQEKNSFGCQKEVMVDLLADYFNNEDGQAREHASTVLRRFKHCGWIFEEDDVNYQVLIHFTHYAIPVLKTLIDIEKDDELEYLGYIHIIYSVLKHREEVSLNDVLDQVYRNTNLVMNKLKSLNSNIKNYLQALLDKQDQQDLKSIVENLFVDYKKNIIDSHYQRLKTSDNIIKYRPFVINQLNEISLDKELIEQLAEDLVEKEKISSIDVAKKHLYELIDYIIQSFENFDEILDEIDKKNTKYIHTSIQKILFIVNNKKDIAGKINKILQYQVKHKQHKFDFIRLSKQRYLDTASLYTMPQWQKKEPQMINVERNLSFEEKQKRIIELFESGKYSISRIDTYVSDLLETRNEICASTIPLDDYESYTRLILIYMYSNSEVSYTIEPYQNYVEQNGFSFYDFKIKKNKGEKM